MKKAKTAKGSDPNKTQASQHIEDLLIAPLPGLPAPERPGPARGGRKKRKDARKQANQERA